MTEHCVFCKIVRKEVPLSLIYENKEALAFLDIRPANEGHTLVIPKKHYMRAPPEQMNPYRPHLAFL